MRVWFLPIILVLSACAANTTSYDIMQIESQMQVGLSSADVIEKFGEPTYKAQLNQKWIDFEYVDMQTKKTLLIAFANGKVDHWKLRDYPIYEFSP